MEPPSVVEQTTSGTISDKRRPRAHLVVVLPASDQLEPTSVGRKRPISSATALDWPTGPEVGGPGGLTEPRRHPQPYFRGGASHEELSAFSRSYLSLTAPG